MWRLEIHYGYVEEREKSKYWLGRAAGAGDLRGMREFGLYMCNSPELGAKQEGWRWLEKAHAAGHKDATKTRLDLLCKSEIEQLAR